LLHFLPCRNGKDGTNLHDMKIVQQFAELNRKAMITEIVKACQALNPAADNGQHRIKIRNGSIGKGWVNIPWSYFRLTLNKSEKDYSPSTMYQDYSINEELFHWQFIDI